MPARVSLAGLGSATAACHLKTVRLLHILCPAAYLVFASQACYAVPCSPTQIFRGPPLSTFFLFPTGNRAGLATLIHA